MNKELRTDISGSVCVFWDGSLEPSSVRQQRVFRLTLKSRQGGWAAQQVWKIQLPN